MRPLALVIALVAAAGLTGCRKADCVSICEARDKILKCGSTNCKELCSKLQTSPVCGPQLKAFEACVLKQPVENWTCDDAREPMLKPGVCMPERGAVMTCLQHAPPELLQPAAPPAKP